jgi:hypothetical protein
MLVRFQLSNKFRVLEADTLELSQQTPVLLKQRGKELKSLTVKTEKNTNKRNVLLLGSSHGREISLMLQGNLGTKFDISNQMILMQRLLM